MSFRAHHHALLAAFQQPLSPAERYRARVMADGGTVFSMAAVEAAYVQAAAWGLPEATTHWSSPQFGTKTNGNQVEVRYCLFAHDAIPVSAAGSWITQPGSAGKPPQHYTGKFGMQLQGLPWADIDLTTHVVFQPFSWQTDVFPYFPFVESSGNPSQYGGVFMGAEDGFMKGGYADPGGVSATRLAGYPPLNALGTAVLRIDKSLALPGRRRMFVNAAEGLDAADTGPPTLAAYAPEPIYLGLRGEAQQYVFNGNINDVFITNKVLPGSALAYLSNQKNAY